MDIKQQEVAESQLPGARCQASATGIVKMEEREQLHVSH